MTANIGFALLFAAAAVFLFWKCRFGFGNCDEAFYLATPLRLYQGDALFLTEWHLSQMSSVLLLPFVSLYMAIFKSTAGIIMAFRYLYLTIHGIVSLLFFLSLRKINSFGAAVASLAFFIYAPFSINAMSYNSLGIGCLAIACVLVYSSGEKSKIKYVFSGIFYAFSVLCCPYLAVIFFIYSVAVLINELIFKKKSSENTLYLNIKPWLLFTVGVTVIAVVFLVFVLCRASVSDIMRALPEMFNDPEHESLGLPKKAELYYKSIVELTPASTKPLYLIFAVLFAVSLFDKKRKDGRAVYLIAFTAVALALFFIINTEKKFINLTLLPLNILALGCYPVFRDNPKIRKLFCTVWITGFIYSFCIHLSSNQLYLAISSASAVSLVGSIMIIAESYFTVIRENEKPFKMLSTLILAVTFAVQLGMLTSYRYKEVFWEDGMETVTEKIDDGVEKGVYTSVYKKSEYQNVLKAKDYISMYHPDAKSILFFSDYTWPYLIFDNCTNSAYSAWLSGVSQTTFERLKVYYQINPDKLPDIVYIDRFNADYALKFENEYGYASELLDTGAVILTIK